MPAGKSTKAHASGNQLATTMRFNNIFIGQYQRKSIPVGFGGVLPFFGSGLLLDFEYQMQAMKSRGHQPDIFLIVTALVTFLRCRCCTDPNPTIRC
jgi:hypothetical protein